jgi:hypothetical protein
VTEPLIEGWHHSRRTRWVRTVLEDRLPPSVSGPLQSSRTITPIREIEALEGLLDDDANAIHLLLKWRAAEEPRTIELHREIADQRGAVWWGKIGDPDGRSAMSGTYLDRFREQLRESTATHVYLYRAGDLWRGDGCPRAYRSSVISGQPSFGNRSRSCTRWSSAFLTLASWASGS